MFGASKSTGVTSPLATGTSSLEAFGPNADRLSLTIQNASTGTIYIKFSDTGIVAATTDYNFVMSGSSYDYITIDKWQGYVHILASTAATPVGLLEVAVSTG